MSFINLRVTLTEPKPDLNKFVEQLDKEDVKKEDLDLLLRKAVESKVSRFH